MPPRKSVVKSTEAVSSRGTAAAESPATDTSIRRVTRTSEIPVELARLPNKSPKRKTPGRTNPLQSPRPVPLKENVPLAKSTPSKPITRRSATADPVETLDRSEDEAEPSPRQSARARKQTARATESWALKKTKKKVDEAKQNQTPLTKESIPSPEKVAAERRTLECLDKADAHINAEADSRNLTYKEELKRVTKNKKRGSMWPAEDSYDDGRLPDTEDDDKARSILAASNTTTSLPAKKTLKRVTKRRSLMNENDDVEMDDDETEAILYEPRHAKNGTPQAKRRKLTIDLEDKEEIVASDLSPSKKPRTRATNGAFGSAEQSQKKCYCCQTTARGRGGWKRKHIGVAVKDVCNVCSEKSALAIVKELRHSLITQAKEKIKASQSERDSVEEASTRSRKATDTDGHKSAEESSDGAEKQRKTAREKSLEKARAVKAQKTYKSKVSNHGLQLSTQKKVYN